MVKNYPDSLMISFTAEWASGEIAVDNDEISDARWFTVDDMPLIPDKVSIARSLIDQWRSRVMGNGNVKDEEE